MPKVKSKKSAAKRFKIRSSGKLRELHIKLRKPVEKDKPDAAPAAG